MKKPIYNIYTLTARMVVLSLLTFSSVMAQGASEPTSEPLDPSTFDGIKITLQSPNTSGALVLDTDKTKQCYYDVDAEGIYLNLSNLAQGRHRVVAKVQYGTNVYVLGIFDFIVAADLPEGTDNLEQEIIVVKTVGDGDKSGADATVYAKDGDGNAHVTTPLSIGSGVASETGAIASGYAGEGASIAADATGAIASGYAGEGAIIQGSGEGAIASGYADEGATIQASGTGAIASGYADTTNGNVEARGVASQAFGMGTKTQTDGQMVIGKCNVVDTDDEYALIVGNGEDDEHRSNALAIDWNGNLVRFFSGVAVRMSGYVLGYDSNPDELTDTSSLDDLKQVGIYEAVAVDNVYISEVPAIVSVRKSSTLIYQSVYLLYGSSRRVCTRQFLNNSSWSSWSYSS